MRRVGQILMGIGVSVGVVTGIAMLGHLGVAGAPWLVNVALAKLGLAASLGLMAGGAGAIRVGKIREQRALSSATDTTKQLEPPRK